MNRETAFKPMLLMLLLFCLSSCSFLGFYDVPDFIPSVYYDDYGRVWTAAINALDEEGYVIAKMRRSEGYISTDKRERGKERVKLSLRFYNTEDGGIQVRITQSLEMYYGEINEFLGGGVGL